MVLLFFNNLPKLMQIILKKFGEKYVFAKSLSEYFSADSTRNRKKFAQKIYLRKLG